MSKATLTVTPETDPRHLAAEARYLAALGCLSELGVQMTRLSDASAELHGPGSAPGGAFIAGLLADILKISGQALQATVIAQVAAEETELLAA